MKRTFPRAKRSGYPWGYAAAGACVVLIWVGIGLLVSAHRITNDLTYPFPTSLEPQSAQVRFPAGGMILAAAVSALVSLSYGSRRARLLAVVAMLLTLAGAILLIRVGVEEVVEAYDPRAFEPAYLRLLDPLVSGIGVPVGVTVCAAVVLFALFKAKPG